MNKQELFMVFFVIWCVLGLASAAFYFLNKNAAMKRKWHPWIAVFVGVVFIGFLQWDGLPGPSGYIMIPAVILITYINLKAFKFCDGCGATLHFQPFQSMNYCPKCGESLDEQAKARLSISSSGELRKSKNR